jgi:quercetin dioxygenase-like cupin family protein
MAMIDHRTYRASGKGYIKVVDGIERKTLVFGEKTLLSEFRLEKGTRLPFHKHPYEQTGYLVSGHLVLIIDGQRSEMRPGFSWSIPGGIEHGAEILEESVAVEVFSPVREDYLPWSEFPPGGASAGDGQAL